MGLLTQEKLQEIGHGRAERALDLEATMETVSPNPLWEIHPLGLRLVDRGAVREYYRLLFEELVPHLVGFPAHSTERIWVYGDDCYVIETEVRLRWEGRVSDSYHAVVVTCDDRYITSERDYASGPLAALLEDIYGGQFRKYPGVVEMFP